ncbi:hypothetical protein BH23BAC1_BH23BAC1_05800 [soil metagenome]
MPIVLAVLKDAIVQILKITLMKNRFTSQLNKSLFSLPAALLFFALIVSLESKAQEKRALSGEMATCLIKLPAKNRQNSNERALPTNHQAALNQMGYFDKITDVPPLENIPIEIHYPDGTPGEKVVILVQDGGLLDNGNNLKVAKLDHENKLSFSFQVTDHPGIHRVMLKKEMDTKVIQLWVGPESDPIKN